METKFFADNGTELDLSNIKISLQETNSKMSDQLFSKFMFPFEIYIDDEFLAAFGDYLSYENSDLDNVIKGNLLFENKTQEATLNILSLEGNQLIGQIDFGLEELPNFNKKLAELPLEKFKVDDIHTFAKTVCEKKYPQTNFNFPRIYTKKYPPDNPVWDAFDGYYNDLKTDGTEMRRNYIDGAGDIYNVNIIHPTPHPIYLLKVGFQDAGYELAGDILTDPDLAQRWVFSGTEYFTSKLQRRYGFIFSSAEFDELFLENGPDDYALYQKYNTIEKTGIYKIAGTVSFFKARKMISVYKILLNGLEIWSKTQGRDSQTVIQEIPLNFEFNVTEENSILEFYAYTQFHEDTFTNQISNLTVTSNALEDISNESLGEESGVVTNLNEVDLTRAVPDMTFGEYHNIIKNWLNYDTVLIGNIIYMNRIANENPDDIKDFQEFEILKPKINLLQKKSFLLKFTDLDDEKKKDSMFFDKNGPKINGKETKETDIIEINGYTLPVFIPKPGGYNTANVLRDASNCVALVGYEGMTGTNNNAVNPVGMDFPELFEKNWKKWLRQRINGKEFQWKFLANAETFSQFSIKDKIFCYNNAHNIKSWLKTKVGENTYEIEITTETIL